MMIVRENFISSWSAYPYGLRIVPLGVSVHAILAFNRSWIWMMPVGRFSPSLSVTKRDVMENSSIFFKAWVARACFLIILGFLVITSTAFLDITSSYRSIALRRSPS